MSRPKLAALRKSAVSTGAFPIQDLPEELILKVLSMIQSPKDACSFVKKLCDENVMDCKDDNMWRNLTIAVFRYSDDFDNPEEGVEKPEGGDYGYDEWMEDWDFEDGIHRDSSDWPNELGTWEIRFHNLCIVYNEIYDELTNPLHLGGNSFDRITLKHNQVSIPNYVATSDRFLALRQLKLLSDMKEIMHKLILLRTRWFRQVSLGLMEKDIHGNSRHTAYRLIGLDPSFPEAGFNYNDKYADFIILRNEYFQKFGEKDREVFPILSDTCQLGADFINLEVNNNAVWAYNARVISERLTGNMWEWSAYL